MAAAKSARGHVVAIIGGSCGLGCSIGPDQIHVLAHRNSRSRITAETTQFTDVFTSVTRQLYGRYAVCTPFQCHNSVLASGRHSRNTFLPLTRRFCPKSAPSDARKREKIAKMGRQTPVHGQKHGNSRVIHAAFATWQFTIRVTRESGLGQLQQQRELRVDSSQNCSRCRERRARRRQVATPLRRRCCRFTRC